MFFSPLLVQEGVTGYTPSHALKPASDTAMSGEPVRGVVGISGVSDVV
jgi:hypothetical protein